VGTAVLLDKSSVKGAGQHEGQFANSQHPSRIRLIDQDCLSSPRR